MAHGRIIIGLNENVAKQKAAMINERRRQSQKWLARNSQKKKQSIREEAMMMEAPSCEICSMAQRIPMGSIISNLSMTISDSYAGSLVVMAQER
jgi:hypothetical protein